VTFKPSRATDNDVAGRIRPAGLVFDTCAVDAASRSHSGLSALLKGTSTRAELNHRL